jgi:hypothetical protein
VLPAHACDHCRVQDTCLDAAQLPNQVKGCCQQTCSTYYNLTTGQATDGVCCPWKPQPISLITGGKILMCCPDGSIAQRDGTCCKKEQSCGGSGGVPLFCCPDGQTCQGGKCLCPSPKVSCAFWPSLKPGDCCARDSCLPSWDPNPPLDGQPIKGPACCPAVSVLHTCAMCVAICLWIQCIMN